MAGRKKSSKTDPRTKRYGPETKAKALELMGGGMKPTVVSRKLGPTTETLRLWRMQAKPENGSNEPAGPSEAQDSHESTPPRPVLSPGGLSPVEQEAIVQMKKRHPSYGPEQVQAQLRRFKGWRISRRAIARVFRDNGYELVHVASRPKGDEHPHRWEAPRRNALWQADLTDLMVGADKRALAVVLDDFSRFVVGWQVYEAPSGEGIVEVVRRAIGLHGKPEAVYTDRGGVFLDWSKETSFQRFLAEQLIDHVVGKPYRPQGRGKVEALFKSIRRELWQVHHFESWDEAHDALGAWFHAYNNARAHMGIDGLTPADRFHGRWHEVRARVEAAARGRLASGSDDARIFEEGTGCGAPVDVLRLVVTDAGMELRLLGHRVVLGGLDG
jgi:transposase InsO family protein